MTFHTDSSKWQLHWRTTFCYTFRPYIHRRILKFMFVTPASVCHCVLIPVNLANISAFEALVKETRCIILNEIASSFENESWCCIAHEAESDAFLTRVVTGGDGRAYTINLTKRTSKKWLILNYMLNGINDAEAAYSKPVKNWLKAAMRIKRRWSLIKVFFCNAISRDHILYNNVYNILLITLTSSQMIIMSLVNLKRYLVWKFQADDEVIQAIYELPCTCLKNSFLFSGIEAFPIPWRKFIERNVEYVEKWHTSTHC